MKFSPPMFSTRLQVVARVQSLNDIHASAMVMGLGVPGYMPHPVTIPGVPGQWFYVLRVAAHTEAHYIGILGWHPISRMPEKDVVDFLLNVKMEEKK